MSKKFLLIIFFIYFIYNLIFYGIPLVQAAGTCCLCPLQNNTTECLNITSFISGNVSCDTFFQTYNGSPPGTCSEIDCNTPGCPPSATGCCKSLSSGSCLPYTDRDNCESQTPVVCYDCHPDEPAAVWVEGGACNAQNICEVAQAQKSSLTLRLQIPIPGMANPEITINGDTIGTYISYVYRFFVGALSIIAVVMIMIGGFQWLMAAGSAEKVSHAKETIFGAIIGLVLALTSYLLLYTINPNLVQYQSLVVTYVTPNQLGGSTGGTLINLQHQLGDGYEFYADLNKYENTWLPQTAAALDRVIDKLQATSPPLILHIEAGSRGIDKQKQLYSQICGSGTTCNNSCPTVCNPYCTNKNCSHANAIDIRTTAYSAADYAIVQETLKSEGFCKYPAENNHFENPKWTSTCNMDY